MNKTLIALLTAASFLTLGAAQAADKPMDKPAAESAKPADSAKPVKAAKHHARHHARHHAKKAAKKAEVKPAETTPAK